MRRNPSWVVDDDGQQRLDTWSSGKAAPRVGKLSGETGFEKRQDLLASATPSGKLDCFPTGSYLPR